MDLSHVVNSFKDHEKIEVDGIIGADILTDGNAVIDYSKLLLY